MVILNKYDKGTKHVALIEYISDLGRQNKRYFLAFNIMVNVFLAATTLLDLWWRLPVEGRFRRMGKRHWCYAGVVIAATTTGAFGCVLVAQWDNVDYKGPHMGALFLFVVGYVSKFIASVVYDFNHSGIRFVVRRLRLDESPQGSYGRSDEKSKFSQGYICHTSVETELHTQRKVRECGIFSHYEYRKCIHLARLPAYFVHL
jgi:hypothetical protein